MPTATDCRNYTQLDRLCQVIGVTNEQWRRAAFESRFNYCEYTKIDRRTGKPRELCHPPPKSVLALVQNAIKKHILANITVSDEVRGYKRGQHNIGVAAEISGRPYQGNIDLHKFHPSTNTGEVATALAKHGIHPVWSRHIAKLVTFRNRLPQGASTSNHVANIVLDVIMQKSILPFAKSRHVVVRNYGDDIVFSGEQAQSVKQCVRNAIREVNDAGFRTNEKGRLCEHRGEARLFIGCATGRKNPDYPRARYLAFRSELRAVLHSLRLGTRQFLPNREINSIRQRIVYVARLNKNKARKLRDLFYRICASNRHAVCSSRC